MHIFYTGQPLSDQYTLSEEESKHAIRVLRLSVNDEVVLVDGLGGYYRAVISDDHPKRCMVQVKSVIKEYGKRKHHLHMAVAPTKNIERFEWFLEKAGEIGIDEITPLITKNGERDQVKHDRLEKVLVSAIKQSIKAYLPILNEPVGFEKFVRDNEEKKSTKLIAHCYDQEKTPLKNLTASDMIILIGPEGDFSVDEVDDAISKGYTGISLSDSRLRTETAAIVACCLANNL